MSQDFTNRDAFESPIEIGGVLFSNRIVIPAHTYGFPVSADGFNQLYSYVRRRLKTGVGGIVIGEAEVPCSWSSAGRGKSSRFAGESSRALYALLRNCAQETGGRIVEQLFHPGGQVWFEESRHARGPSSISQPQSAVVPSRLSNEDISELYKSFCRAAEVAFEEGLNGVEIKADQGKLHHQFLSHSFNDRSDDYGGSLYNRARFLLETLRAIRRCVPSGFCLGVRLAGHVTPPLHSSEIQWTDDVQLEDSLALVRILEEENLVDYISLSGESNSTLWGYRESHGDEEISDATFSMLGATFKKATKIPIMLSGRIHNFGIANSLLNDNCCDLVGMARAFIADGELLEKYRASLVGGKEPIRPCVSCNIVCVDRTWNGGSVQCIYDPLSGREASFDSLVAKTPPEVLKIAVVGGGPTGMEFARVASQLGQAVTIFEKSDRLGGSLSAWALLPGRSRFREAEDFWIQCVKLSSVRVNLGAPISNLDKLSKDFDHIVLATGGLEPDKTSHNSSNVLSISPFAAMSLNISRSLSIVVFDADPSRDMLGVAIYLADLGHRILVISPFDDVGCGLDFLTKACRMHQLEVRSIGIQRYSDVRIDISGILVHNHFTNHVSLLSGYDCVVWGVSKIPNTFPSPLADHVHRLGSESAPISLEKSLKQAYDLAFKLSGLIKS